MLRPILNGIIMLGCAALASIGFEWVAPEQRWHASLAWLGGREPAGSGDGAQTPPHSKVFYMSAAWNLDKLVLNPHKGEWKCTTK
jgi:hypothetical protein